MAFGGDGANNLAVRGGRVRVLLALAVTGVVAAIGVSMGSGGGAAKQERATGSAPLAPSGASAVRSTTPSTKLSPAQTVSVSQGVLVPAIRSQPRVKNVPRNTRPQNELNEAGPPLRVPLKSLPEGDGALQTTPGKSNTPAPSLTFEGVNNMCGCYPPDTNGDVGGTQYMQWVNLHFAIYDKNTGAQLQAPRPGNQLFTGLSVCGTENAGDPVTIYDQYAGRFVASQFGDSGAPYYQCVAVSTSDDATGTWCAYQFNVHNTKFNDYPKMGVWPSQNAYMMTANQFPPSGFGGVGVWAFERDQMIANGCPAARMVYQDMNDIEPYLSPLMPADADGDTMPPADAPAPLVSINQDGSGLPDDQLQIWNATVNWDGSPSMTVTHESDVQAAAFDENLCDFGNCIPQPGTGVRLQTLSDRIMFRAQYRNFGGW